MAVTLEAMPTKRPSGGKKPEPSTDRHKKKPFQMRLHPLLRQQLEILAATNASDMTAEISIAVRERLERAGLWPPPEHKKNQHQD